MLTVGGLAAASASAEPPTRALSVDTSSPIPVALVRIVEPASPSATVPAGTTATAAAQQALAAAADYWRESTGGSVDFAPAATVIDVPLAGSSCIPNLGAVVRDGLGDQVSAGQRLVVLAPACPGEKSASVSSDGADLLLRGDAAVADATVPSATIIGLLGRSIGLAQVSEYVCPAGSTRIDLKQPGCTVRAGAGMYSAMSAWPQGSAVPHESAAQLFAAGLLPDDSIQPAAVGSTNELSPVAGGAGVRALTVADPASGDTFVLEYRTAVGLDDGAVGTTLPAGVIVSRVSDDGRTVQLLDAQPAASSDTALPGFDGNPTLPTGSSIRLGDAKVAVRSTGSTALVTVAGVGVVESTPAVAAPADTVSSTATATPPPAEVVAKASPTSKRTSPTSTYTTSSSTPTSITTDIFGSESYVTDTVYPTDTLYTTDTYDPFAYTTEPTQTYDSLASTGASETLAILGIGLGLLTGGAALVLVTRPRRRGERQI
jgi:hypothetical protein